jgi:hypothetical protein
MAKPQFLLYPTYEEFLSLFDNKGNRLKGIIGIYKEYLNMLKRMEQKLIMEKCWSTKEVKNNTITANVIAHDVLFEGNMCQRLQNTERAEIKKKLIKILVNKLR